MQGAMSRMIDVLESGGLRYWLGGRLDVVPTVAAAARMRRVLESAAERLPPPLRGTEDPADSTPTGKR
jgi:hypothetical protein